MASFTERMIGAAKLDAATYAVAGKQYVVIAAGGAGKLGTKAGDYFIAFVLPDEED